MTYKFSINDNGNLEIRWPGNLWVENNLYPIIRLVGIEIAKTILTLDIPWTINEQLTFDRNDYSGDTFTVDVLARTDVADVYRIGGELVLVEWSDGEPAEWSLCWSRTCGFVEAGKGLWLANCGTDERTGNHPAEAIGSLLYLLGVV